MEMDGRRVARVKIQRLREAEQKKAEAAVAAVPAVSAPVSARKNKAKG